MGKRHLLWSLIALLFAGFLIGHSGIAWHFMPNDIRGAVSEELIFKWQSFVGDGGVLAFLSLYALVLGGWLARMQRSPDVAGGRPNPTLFTAVRAHLPEILIVALLGYAVYQAADDTLLFVARVLESVLARNFDWLQLGRSASFAVLHVALLVCAAHVTFGWGSRQLACAAAVALIVAAIGIPANNAWTIHDHNQSLTRVFEVMGSAFVTSAIEIWLALIVLGRHVGTYRTRLQLHSVGMRGLIPAALTGIGVIVAIQLAVRSLSILPRSLNMLDVQMLAIKATWAAGALIALALAIRGGWRAIASVRCANAPTVVARRSAMMTYRFVAVAVAAIAAAALCYFVSASLETLTSLASLSSRGFDRFVGGLLWGLALVLLAPGIIFCSGIVLFGWTEFVQVRRESALGDKAP